MKLARWLLDVTLICPQHTDGALGYTFRFGAEVKDGALHARGFTGDPSYNVDRVSKSTAYRYHVRARFEGSRGTGSRVETRVCDLTFVER